MEKCSVFGITHDGTLTNQCINLSDETIDYADLIEEMNNYWHERDERLKLTGTAICFDHLNTVKDI
jgi:hypothetical protein